ncbi:MAG: CRTAC1 family protein [Planctomycetes bacterium]|nr:CRTAC1 family protein [Planctomycetota bacterium]
MLAILLVLLIAGLITWSIYKSRPSPDSANPAAQPSREPVFSEIASAVGLDFIHYTGATGEYYLPEIMGSGCAFIDYDRDEDLDIYVVQGALLGEGKSIEQSTFPPRERPPRNKLFRNDLIQKNGVSGKLSFTDITTEAGVGDPAYGMGCAVGDYDNDGYPDLYVTNFGPNVLYHNNGNGTFSEVSRQAGVDDPRFSASAAFLDYNRDGYLDLFVTNYVDFSTAANRECTRLGGQKDYCGPKSYEPSSNRLFRNNRNGTFTDATREAGLATGKSYYSLGVIGADFNGDGWMDIFVANDATPNQLWINQKKGAFEEKALFAGVAVNNDGQTEACMGVTAADFDRDGDEDIFVTNEQGEKNTLYRNLGKGLFEDASFQTGLATPSLPNTGFGTLWFDYDNDGWLDLFVANGAVRKLANQIQNPYPFHQPDQLYHNQGGLYFETTPWAGAGVTELQTGRGAAFGDVDNDGDLDILVSNNHGPLRLLLNNIGNRKNWVRFFLVGTTSNRDALGAHVLLKLPGGLELWQRVGTDGSYCSANDQRLHFGVGQAKYIESATVYWPSGKKECWKTVPLNKSAVLREGKGLQLE